MTETPEHQPREALGLWHEGPQHQRRDVIVILGAGSLIIASPARAALAHWSFAALERLNPCEVPALYAPGTDALERLEIADADMVAEIDRIRGTIARARPHPGRLRWLGALILAVGLLLAGVTWLPDALARQAAQMVPPAARGVIGAALLDEVAHLGGMPCTGEGSRAALDRLSERMFFDSDTPPALHVFDIRRPLSVALPGNLIVLSATLAEDHETPEVLAGHLLVEDLRRRADDPLLALLRASGTREVFRLLTTGRLSDDALRAHAVRLLNTPRPAVAEADLITRFAAARLSTRPYARALDITGETVGSLLENDPMAGRARGPLLSDAAWVRLQNICT